MRAPDYCAIDDAPIDGVSAATPTTVPRIQDLPSLQTTSGGEASHALATLETTAESTAYRESETGGAHHMQPFENGPGEGRIVIGAPAAAKTTRAPRAPHCELRGALQSAARSTHLEGRLASTGPERVSFDPYQSAATSWQPLRARDGAATDSHAPSLGEKFEDARARAERSLEAAAGGTMDACRAMYRLTFGALPATLRRLSLLASAVFAVYVLAALSHPHEALAQAGPASGEGAGAGGFDPISTTLANIRDYLIRILVYFGGISFAITFILMMVALADERAQRGAKLAAKFSFIGLIGGVLVTSIVQIAIGFAPGGGGGAA